MQTLPTNPDTHFLVFAPGLESWLFLAARRYWAAFRPITYSMRTPEDIDLVTYATQESSQIVVTLIMRRDTAPAVRAVVMERLPGVFLDPLVYDVPVDLQLTLNGRAEFNQRFGLPTDSAGPQPTRTPGPIQLPGN